MSILQRTTAEGSPNRTINSHLHALDNKPPKNFFTDQVKEEIRKQVTFEKDEMDNTKKSSRVEIKKPTEKRPLEDREIRRPYL